MPAHVTCKNRACRLRVRLTDEQCDDLWRSLRVAVTCPGCATAFVKEVVKTPRERPTPVVQAPPIPVPAGTDKKQPPFRALPAAPDEAPPRRPAQGPRHAAASPRVDPDPAVELPTADANAAPFAPIPFGQPAQGGAKAFGPFGRWNRTPKRKQNALLAVALVLAAGFAMTVKLRGHLTAARPAADPQVEVTPVNPAPAAPVAVEPLRGGDEADPAGGSGPELPTARPAARRSPRRPAPGGDS